MSEPEHEQLADNNRAPLPRGKWFEQHAWLPFLAPLILYMLVQMFFATSPPGDHLAPEHLPAAEARYQDNLLWKATAMAGMAVPIGVLLGVSLYLPRFRISWLAIVVGVVGVVLWVGVDAIGIRQWASALLGEESRIGSFLFPPRDALNPFDVYGGGTPRFWWFMITRFIGLALIVPVIEELMLRGWLMRLVDNPQFWQVPFGQVSLRAAAIGVGFEALIHPEKLAAIVWFSLVTWLMYHTKNFWDCVAAHAVTNFLLGIWVIWQGAWELW